MNNTNKDRIYVLKRKSAPLSYMLKSRHSALSPLLYYDEEKNQTRALRYANNQSSPFEDEQDGNAVLSPVVFENGFLKVPKSKPALQKFLEVHPANGRIFQELDRAKTAEEEIQKILDEESAVGLAKDMSITDLENIGRVILGKNIDIMSSAELRIDVLVYARKNPESFLSTVSDPSMKQVSVAMELFEKGLIAFRNDRKEIFYNLPDNRKRMLVVPTGKDPIDHLVGFLETKEGNDVLEMLESHI